MPASGRKWASFASWLLKSHLRRGNKKGLTQSSQLMSAVKRQEHIFWNPTGLGLHSSSAFY